LFGAALTIQFKMGTIGKISEFAYSNGTQLWIEKYMINLQFHKKIQQ
jgi:hypothetical protein